MGVCFCSIAKVGEIIISEHVYARVKDRFEVIELPPTAVKGKSQPLKIYNVVGAKRAPVFDDKTRPA
jgi:adenylate cyclase